MVSITEQNSPGTYLFYLLVLREAFCQICCSFLERVSVENTKAFQCFYLSQDWIQCIINNEGSKHQGPHYSCPSLTVD